MSSVADQPRLAVLIDAENAQPRIIEGLLEEIARLGAATVKRIYGDWTSPAHTSWKRSLLKHSIQPVQQFSYTSGKNATDSALIIDAMDLLYTRRFSGFCLVSSDSDFTRLAQRIREEGLTVYGFGERKTPEPFVVACDKFIYTELLRKDETGLVIPPTVGGKPGAGKPTGNEPAQLDPVDLLRKAIAEADDDAGWAALAAVGSYLTKLRPDFDPRLFGMKKLSDLVRHHSAHFELREQPVEGTSSHVLFVRLR